jgi:RNA recognition motif-containing protein
MYYEKANGKVFRQVCIPVSVKNPIHLIFAESDKGQEMAKKIYVGNLSFRTDESGLSELFSQYGEVVSANIITDRETGRSRGFAFVEMADDAQALEAVEALNNQEYEGRQLNISEARPRKDGERPRRDFNRYE